MALSDSTSVWDILEFLQTLLQDYLATEITSLGYTTISAPLDEDIQIGPEFAFGADPVIGLEWVSTRLLGQLAPREERLIRIKLSYFFNVSAGTQYAAQMLAEADRAVWYTLHRHYRTSDPTIIQITQEDTRPITRERPTGGIQGYGIEMMLDCRAWFTLPPGA